jgi:hypothetical protein
MLPLRHLRFFMPLALSLMPLSFDYAFAAAFDAADMLMPRCLFRHAMPLLRYAAAMNYAAFSLLISPLFRLPLFSAAILLIISLLIDADCHADISHAF